MSGVDTVVLPAILRAYPRFDGWLRFDPAGHVIVLSGKVEFGQGIRTAIAQLVADELDLSIDDVSVAAVDTDSSPDEGVTSGSRSIEEANEAVRRVAAETRQAIVRAAARRLGISETSLRTADGRVLAPDGTSLPYSSLIDAELLSGTVDGAADLKMPAERSIIGLSVPRTDLPGKIRGEAAFVQDLDLPGMLHGRVVRPPVSGARLTALDEDEVRAMPGVRALIRDGSFVGVIAAREEQAIRAARRIHRIATWTDGRQLPADARFLLDRPTEDLVVHERRQIDPAPPTTREFAAEYSRPYIAHASLGPSCAVAVLEGERVVVWSHSQGVHDLQRELVKALRVAPAFVRVIHMEGAGCYGANGADDAAFDAAFLARTMPGQPVRVQWTREDEFAWEPFGTAMFARLRATVDARGDVVDWNHELWGNGHRNRPGPDAPGDETNLLGASELENGFKLAVPPRPPGRESGGGRNAAPVYQFPNQRVVNHFVADAPIRVSALRSLGAHLNVFAIESFIDELAAAAGVDPIDYRLRSLVDARARAVLDAVGGLSGWPTRERGSDVGLGVGFAQYKNAGCYVGVVAEVRIGDELEVTRVWAVVDAGLVVNPDGLINQVEGGIVQAASWTLKEEVRFTTSAITSTTWESYPILRFSEVPEVHVRLIEHPELAPLGVGEAVAGPTAAAIGNAFFAATGLRVRDMPLSKDRILRAMA